MIEFTDKDLEECESNILNPNSSLYWERRLKSRLEYLNPLIKELQDKGINLIELSNDLNNEYNSLIMLRNKYLLK